MISINKYILIFALFVTALIVAVMQIVQSERFSRILVQEIESSVLQDTGMSLRFDTVGLSLFPPATSITNVEFTQNSLNQKLDIKAKSVTVEFSFINMLASKIVLEALALKDAKVEISSKENDSDVTSEGKEPITFQSATEVLENIVTQVQSALPVQVNELDLRRVYVNTENGSGFISELDLKLYSNFIIGTFQINELYHPGEFEEVSLNAIDSIKGEIEISKTKLEAKNIVLKNKLNELTSSLVYNFSQKQYEMELDYKGGLDGQFKRLLDKYNQKAQGYAEAIVRVEGVEKDFTANLELNLFDLETNYVLADKVSLLASYQNDSLRLEQLSVEHDKGKLLLEAPVNLIDVANKKISAEILKLQAQDFHTNSALYAIRKSLEVMKGRLNGGIEVSFLEKQRRVKFLMQSGLKMKDFSLELGGEEPLLRQSEVLFSQGEIFLNIDNSLVDIETSFRFGEKSTLNAKGSIGLGKINIETKDSVLDFNELGPISGFAMTGHGPFALNITGPLKKVEFDIEADHKDFSLLGFNLEDVKASAKLSLSPLSLKIETLDGGYEDASYSSFGVVDFVEKKFSLDVSIFKMNYREAKHLLAPIAALTKNLPEKLDFQSNGKFKVAGGFQAGELDIDGNVLAKQILYQGEDIEQMSFGISYKGDDLSIRDLVLKKSESLAKGSFSMNFKTSYFEYDVSWNNIQLSDWDFYTKLRFGLSSKLDLDFYGSGQIQDYTTRTQANLRESSIQGFKLDDSLITVFNESSEYYVNATLFGQMLNLDSYINTEGSATKELSRVNAKVDIDDIRVPLGLLSSHNISNQNLAGALTTEIKASFQTDKLEKLSLNAIAQEFYLNWGEINFTAKNKELQLDIKEGEFIRQDLEIESSEQYSIKPTVSGSLSEGISLLMNYELPASLLSLLSTDLSVSGGVLKGQTSLRGQLGALNHTTSFETKDVVLQIPQAPGVFEKINLLMNIENKNLVIERSTASYGKGQLELTGVGVLNFPYPSLNLDLLVDNSYIAFMKRSGGVVSGRASLSGEKPPYLVQGHIDILFAEIVENINDFQAAGAQTTSYQRFLPRQDGSGLEHPIELDLTLSILRPLLVRNSLLELNVEGGAKIKGTPTLPLIDGQFNTVAATSKFKFKGHEFNLTKGNIEVGRSLQREGALLDFSGVAQINEYRVRLDVSGRTKNVAVSLSSEPSLSQEDIFSLLTLGVTSEISTELEESERQSVATVGLGALLADQLRLNEGLDSSFGLRLSVAPEYAEETTSLLQGKSAISDNSTNKFKSSTRIRLQKKVSERVDLSVSSTVGGSLEQRQEMNINYRINNRWSLEGVYELKSTEDEGVESSDSVGADLKYRWTF